MTNPFRQSCAAAVAATLAILVGARVTLAQAIRTLAVDSVGIVVSDLDRSVDFFTDVLTFEKISEYETVGDARERFEGVFGARLRVARLRLGDESIDLIQFLAPQGHLLPIDSRSNDLWFQHIAVIVTDIDAAYARLREYRVGYISTGPQRLPDWNPNAGGISAFYFKDPDGHPLEILEFPPDKGAAKWHRKSDRLFLGIDHTAIAVEDTERSLRFYRDRLGLRVAGISENHGTEQEHLGNVFGARVRITGLRAEAGPGIEFLEYLSPSDGRSLPSGSRPNDLIAWRTRIRVADVDVADRVLQAEFSLLSPGRIELDPSPSHYARGVSLRDPDGHVVQLVER
jgi:catechol 2,3-dioxygenase-like lactoylglutathione lyase family enzyme